MLLKMSSVTLLYVLLTLVLWNRLHGRALRPGDKVLIGVLYGIGAILSTHFGIEYGGTLLNVRDIGPLAAGLFFDPFSGILAGLIGGVERYIAGTYWGVGSFTRIACSVATSLAGFVAAFMTLVIFKRKKPSGVYAFCMGAVMEAFHMYVVFITHRDDMSMAYFVVKTCAAPMIVFTGLGLAASSVLLKMRAGEWRNPFRRVKAEEVPVSNRFQAWLFAVSVSVLLVSFGFTFAMQTQTALQSARESMIALSRDIENTFVKIRQTENAVEDLSETTAVIHAKAIAEAAEMAGGTAALDADYLEKMREIYGLEALTLVDRAGKVICSAGEGPVYAALLSEVLSGRVESQSVRPSATRVVAGASCGDAVVQVVINPEALKTALKVSGLNDALSYFHVGSSGTFDILLKPGVVTVGSHSTAPMAPRDRQRINEAPREQFFDDTLFNMKSICYIHALDEGVDLLLQMPIDEVYANRDAQAYETALADIILFTVIYVLIAMLVQRIVVNNLELVNASLDKITHGNLDEVVSVRDSSEFASLSNDINETVRVLKGYIAAAEKRIEQELVLARTIQESALPRNFHFPRADFELFATMDPAKEVGGDFYDFFFVNGSKLGLVIADVSGKGIPAALFMMRGKTAIRSLAESGSAPAEILYKANNTLCEGNDAEMFITAWIGILDLETGVMCCANAGHEYPVLMRAGEDYALFKDRHGLALAAMEDMPFKEYTLKLNPGDRLFVYTDGVPEAIDEQVEQYGLDRLLRVLDAHKAEPMEAVLPAVRQDISAFVGKADQFDDITMLGLTYFGSKGSGTDERNDV